MNPQSAILWQTVRPPGRATVTAVYTPTASDPVGSLPLQHLGTEMVVLEESIALGHAAKKWYRGYAVRAANGTGSAPSLSGIFPASHVQMKSPAAVADVRASSTTPPPVVPRLKQQQQHLQQPPPSPPTPPPQLVKPSQLSSRVNALRLSGLQLDSAAASDSSAPPPAPARPHSPTSSTRSSSPALRNGDSPTPPALFPKPAFAAPSAPYLPPPPPTEPTMSDDNGDCFPKELSAALQRIDTRAIGGMRSISGVASASTKSSSNYHIYFDLKACIASICGPGEMTELYFSLYNKNEARFISEDYLIRLTYNGMPLDEDKIGKLYTIFSDLSKRDMAAEIFLVCRIVRVGKMVLTERDLQQQQHQSDEKSMSTQTTFRRPFGYSVLNITDVVRGTADQTDADTENGEFMMKIYTASSEAQFSTLFENIIGKSGGYETSSRAEMVCVAVRLLNGSISSLLSKDFSHLVDLPVTQRMGFPDVILPGDVRNSVYLTLLSGDFMQGRKTSAKNIEIAVQLRSSTGQPLPASICVGAAKCDTFESVIYYHNNAPKWNETVRLDIPIGAFDRGTHVFLSFRHCSTGDKGDKQDKSFAFAVLPLMRADDTVIRDGSHIINLFKYDKKHVQADVYMGPLVFAAIDRPVSITDMDGLNHPISETALATALADSKLTLTKDSFQLKSSLCSTKLTQDVSLLNLLRWKTLASGDMRSVLKDFTFIGPLEIIKYLQDILDALFAILQHTTTTTQLKMAAAGNNDVPDLIFSAIVFVLNIILSDRRFINFCPILEIYINNHFGLTEPVDAVWDPLLRSMIHLTCNPRDALLGKELRSSIKAWGYIFKLIAKSYASSNGKKAQTAQVLRTEFRRLLDAISENILTTAGSETDANALIGTQILVLQNISDVLVAMTPMQLFTAVELTQFGIQIVESMPAKNKKIVETQLAQCGRLISSSVAAADINSRSMLATTCISLARRVLLADGDTDSAISDAALKLVLQTVDELITVDSLPVSARFPDALQFLSVAVKLCLPDSSSTLSTAVVMAIVQLASFGELKQLLQSGSLTSDDILSMCSGWLLSSSADNDFVPDKLLVAYKLIVACVMVMEAKPYQSWIRVLDTFVLLMRIHSDSFDLSKCGAKLLADIWRRLAGHHSHFLVEFVGPMLQLTLCTSSPQLRSGAIKILVEMITIDRKRTSTAPSAPSTLSTISTVKHLSRVEIECIDQLDRLVVTQAQGDRDFHQWLTMELKAKLPAESSAPFLQSLNKFLSLAFSVRCFGGDEAALAAADSQASSLKNSEDFALLLSHLLHFTALLGRTSIYIKYIHQLANLQVQCGDLAEAGWALKLHADLLDWDTRSNVEPLAEQELPRLEEFISRVSSGAESAVDGGLLHGLMPTDCLQQLQTPQTAFERKELLHLIIILLFSYSLHFEHAIELAQVLAKEYAETKYDYDKVARIYLVLAELATKLNNATKSGSSDQQRFYPSYYRVAFVGKGWLQGSLNDSLLHGKDYIYRGQQWEKLGDFTDRLLLNYPGATVLQSNEWPASDVYASSDSKLVQIAMVKPVADEQRFARLFAAGSRNDVSEKMVDWYAHNDLATFCLTRPFRKENVSSKGLNEFQRLWTEEFLLTTEYQFPHFLRRSEVVSCRRQELAPIENAIRTIRAKNTELQQLERRYQKASDRLSTATPKRMSFAGFHSNHAAVAPAVNCNPLTMSLNGAVDAPVNGGVPMYKDAFLSSADYLAQNPGHADFVAQLRQAIDEQVIILDRCVKLHGEVAPPELQPLHAQIVQFFQKNFYEEIQRLLPGQTSAS